jgi:hypothetical protein
MRWSCFHWIDPTSCRLTAVMFLYLVQYWANIYKLYPNCSYFLKNFSTSPDLENFQGRSFFFLVLLFRFFSTVISLLHSVTFSVNFFPKASSKIWNLSFFTVTYMYHSVFLMFVLSNFPSLLPPLDPSALPTPFFSRLFTFFPSPFFWPFLFYLTCLF